MIYSIILPADAQQNLLDFESSLKFARYLNSTLQYNFAMQEYERLNFLWPGDTSVIIELVKTYRLNNQCDKSDRAFDMIQNNILRYNSSQSAREYLNFALQCRSESDKFFDISSKLKPDERSFYELSYYWVTRKYDSAFYYCHLPGKSAGTTKPELIKLTYDLENEKFKSPAVSLLMSAVIPGSGKLYSKHFGDALVSFLSVTTNAFASYRAFNRKGIKSVNGWIFGSLAFSFYSANLFGSVKSAKKYNSDLKLRYQNNAENIIFSSF